MKAAFYSNLYTRDINRVIAEIKAYPNEESIWEVLPGTTNSGGHLAQHLIGNLKTYIGNPFGKIGYVRNREAEFSARIFTHDELISTLESLVEIVAGSLNSLSEEQLNDSYPQELLSIDPNQTIDLILLHLLAHLSYHLGQINYQRRYYSSHYALQLIPVTVADSDDLVALARQTFVDTYGKDNTEENTQLYLSTSFTKDILEKEINHPGSEFYFATIAGRNVGYLKLNSGDAQSDLRDQNTLEVERIYVLKELQGKKIGQFLMDQAISIAKSKGAEYVWLGVWDKNFKAMKFYKKNNFTPFHQHEFMLGSDVQTDIMMKFSLSGE